MDIWNDVYVKEDKFYSKKDNSLLNGEIETTQISIEESGLSEDDNCETKLNFSKGVLHGKFEQIHPNDNETLKFNGDFKDGKGVITCFDKNGNVFSKGDFHIYFFKVGRDKTIPYFYLQILKELEFYDQDGIIKRRVESFYENQERLTRHHYYDDGKIEFYETLSIDERHGEYKSFYDNGIVESVCEYKRDRNRIGGGKHGFYKEFYNNGSLKIEGSYRDDVKDGRWITYHKNGKIESDGYYVKEKRYNEYGKLYVNFRKGGSKDGIWKYFDDKGQLIKQETWTHGFKHGYFYEKHSDGSETHDIYKNGNRLGKNNIITKLLFKL